MFLVILVLFVCRFHSPEVGLAFEVQYVARKFSKCSVSEGSPSPCGHYAFLFENSVQDFLHVPPVRFERQIVDGKVNETVANPNPHQCEFQRRHLVVMNTVQALQRPRELVGIKRTPTDKHGYRGDAIRPQAFRGQVTGPHYCRDVPNMTQAHSIYFNVEKCQH